MSDKVTIKIPRPLYDLLKTRIQGTGFSSVTEFVVYVMRDIASSGSLQEDSRLDKGEIAQIRGRLKQLGYL